MLIDGGADGTGAVIGAFYAVFNTLRYGFLESVYASALEVEFRERGIAYIREMPLVVEYKGRAIGLYRADFFIGGRLVVEVKATIKITDADKNRIDSGRSFFGDWMHAIKFCYERTPLLEQEPWKRDLMFSFAALALVGFSLDKWDRRSKRIVLSDRR